MRNLRSTDVILNGGVAGVRDRTSVESFDGAGRKATAVAVWFASGALQNVVASLGALCAPQDDN
jgi:hypothetical protein